MELAGRVVHVRKFDLACDVGTLSVAGTFDPDEPTEKLLTQPGVTVGANVELAKLAAKLPKLLHLKDGTELREGKVEAKLASRADAGGVVWEGKVLTSAIKATRDGKPISWEQPLNVEFAGRYASGEIPTFDKLIVTSDFVAVNAKTTPQTVQAAATVYLDRLGARLAEFIDLGGFSLAGTATAQLVGRREADGAFRAAGAVELKEFAFTDRRGKGLTEPALKLQLTATGTAPASGPVALTTATLVLTANGDELHLTLLEPVGDARTLTGGTVDVRVSGDLARWKARAAAITPIPAYEIGGTVVASGKARLAADRVSVERLTVGLTNAHFRGAGVLINEPTMNAVGDLAFTKATGVATITKLTLNSAPLSITNGTLAFELPEKGDVVVSGDGQCVTDLNRLGAVVKLYADARGPDALHGRGVGPLRFRSAGEVTTFGGALDVTNFAYGPKEKPVWAEPALRLDADGDYRDSTDAVTLASTAASRALAAGIASVAAGSRAVDSSKVKWTRRPAEVPRVRAYSGQ